uniref:Nonstructural protein n=1 Tax=Dulem virus 188 TaxID=3145665 RepID=A0AAU8B413_9VIRU
MKFGVYCVRDIKAGFQTPTAQVNDAVAIRGFASAVINSDSVLFTHASDFALYKLAEFDADTGHIIPLELPIELMQASAALRKE